MLEAQHLCHARHSHFGETVSVVVVKRERYLEQLFNLCSKA